MSPLLPLRTIRAYRRMTQPLSALMKAARKDGKLPVGPATIAACNRVIATANRVFSREPSLGGFPLLPPGQPLTGLDLALVVDEIVVAALRFEERHPELDSARMERSVPRY